MQFKHKKILGRSLASLFIAILCFAIGQASLHAHGGGSHDWALPGPLAHWSTGNITYRFQGQFPSNWTTWINDAATRLETDTFVDSLDEDTLSSNKVTIGTWPPLFGRLEREGFDTCEYSGRVGGTIACAYPVSAGLLPIDLWTPIERNDTLWGFAFVFDPVDVYDSGTTNVKAY